MKIIAKILTLALAVATAAGIVSCEPEIEITGITLEVSPASIADDGIEAASFKVKTNTGDDVTSRALIINVDENTTVRGARFSTDVSGVYVFSASYEGMKSNEVAVRVGSGFAGGDGETQWVTTEVKTPIRYAELRHYGSSTATAIDVVRAESGQNGAVLQFSCIPGDEVKSYRVQVYPMAWVYNQLLEVMKGEGKESLTTDDANDALRALITNEEYGVLAGQLMNKETLGSSWYINEFDWLNTSFEKAWGIQADADYLIVTLSSFEETCSDETAYASLAVCHFHTPKVEPTGSPAVDITYVAGFSSYQVTYTANADCKYIYYFSHSTEAIDEYIDAYGKTLFRDFIRHTEPIAMEEPLVVPAGASEILAMKNTAVAIALDEYGIPVDELTRVDFSLLEKPEGRELGKAEVYDFTAASRIVKFKVEMDRNTVATYQGIYTREAAEAYMKGDLASQESIAQSLRLQGWGHANENFKFTAADGVLESSDAYIDDQATWNELLPETEYAILYVALNGYGDLSRLAMSEPFTTRKQQRDISSSVTYDPTFKFSLIPLGVNGLEYSFDFDPAVVAQVFFGAYDPVREFDGIKEGFTYPTENTTRDNWLYWLLDYREPNYGYPWADNWVTPDSPSGHMDASIFDLVPGSQYKYACVYETWDGYISEVVKTGVTLQNISWGADPQVNVTVREENDKYMGDIYYFDIIGNDNVGELKYLGTSDGDENAINFGLSDLLKKADYYSEQDYLKMALARTTALGIATPGNRTYCKVAKEELEKKSIYVLAAVGKGQDGIESVYSPVAYYVWTRESGKFQTLAEYLK